MVTTMRRPAASAIWLAMVRFQIKSKSLNSSALSVLRSRVGQLEGMAGGANRFVRLLGVFDLAAIDAGFGRQKLVAVFLSDQAAGVLDRDRGQIGRIGTHVGDVPVFVQALGNLHRPPGGEAELAVGFLLQRAGGERRVGLGRVRLVFDLGDAELAAADPRGECCRRVLVEQHQLGILELAGGRIEIFAEREPPAVDRDQSGFELLAVVFGELAEQVPPGGGDEGHPLAFALDDQPHGDALHAAGRELRPDLAPEERRDFVAVKPVENSAGFLCADEAGVDVARRFERRVDGRFGDFVEHQAMDGHLRLQISTRCQLMASPSRSSSVAR